MTRDTPPGEGAAETGGATATEPDQPDWSAMARAADGASTSWINSSRRTQWGDSLALFQGRHPSGSKYHGTDYRYRSRLFRPKARATVRKSEAATAQAFFANEQVCSISPENDDDPMQVASAALMQELVQIRFSRHIPWFLIVAGARQDCEVYGLCISRQYWKYEEKLVGVRHQQANDEFGKPLVDGDGLAQQDEYQVFQVTADHPDVELIAPDNFRFDPGCDWTRPVESSPYLVQRIPMFVGDVREKMRAGIWKEYADAAIVSAKGAEDDATKRQREQGRQPANQAQASSVPDFELTWVHLNTLRWHGRDYVFFTLGPDKILTEPRPHIEVYGTEKRPYRIGFTNLEAHRNYPASKLELLRDLQAQANDTTNLRLDALKLSLQPRAKVKAGSPVANNMADLRVFMPGKPVMVTAMDDFEWDRPPDVSQLAYMEQDRINADFDDLAGTFGQSSVSTNREMNETVGGMELLAGAAGTIGEYELRLFVETWVRGVIEDVVDLEQRLEEDETILALAGQKAKLTQKYGLDRVTDWLLSQKLTTKVNVGIGATNPSTRIGHFAQIADLLGKMFGPSAAMGLKFDEVCSEVFGAFGFADGKRFFVEGFDPHQAMMQMEQMKAQAKQRPPAPPDPTRLQAEQIRVQGDLQQTQIQNQNQVQLAQLATQREAVKQYGETQRTQMQQRNELQGHVIRTLPPAMARLLVAQHQTQHAERMAGMQRGAGA